MYVLKIKLAYPYENPVPILYEKQKQKLTI